MYSMATTVFKKYFVTVHNLLTWTSDKHSVLFTLMLKMNADLHLIWGLSN